jgi:hypothetical protein
MKIIENIKSRFELYEQRTGDKLPLNIVAKAAAALGSSALLLEFSNGDAAKDRVYTSMAMIWGGILLDKMTGGLRGYSEEARRLEEEEGF